MNRSSRAFLCRKMIPADKSRHCFDHNPLHTDTLSTQCFYLLVVRNICFNLSFLNSVANTSTLDSYLVTNGIVKNLAAHINVSRSCGATRTSQAASKLKFSRTSLLQTQRRVELFAKCSRFISLLAHNFRRSHRT